MTMHPINSFVYTYLRFIEMIGVLMRIFSFSLVSWLGADSPFMFVWAFNTTDAVILSWCSILKKDNAYTLLNVFWIMVGIVGMVRACHCSIIDVSASMIRFLTQISALFS